MSRNIRDLREIINMSRLSFHEEDDFQCNFSSDEDESSSLDGYIASRPSSALGTRSSFRTLSSASASLNNNNITTSKIPPLSVSCSEQEIRPSIVLIGSHHQHNHQTITDSSSKQILNSHTKQFPSHYTPVPPICHNKDGKYIKQTPGNQSRRRRRRTNFDEVLSYLDSVIVNEWLEECNRTINKLNMFATDGHTVVRFFNFLLDEMKYEDYCDLLDMEYSIMFDRLRYGFHAGFAINKLNNNDLAQLATSVLPEYPDRFKRREGVENLLNVFMVLSSSDKADGYRELLKKVNCTTLNKQYIQWLLAIRAHGLINFVSGILRFYENITQTASSSVTCNLVQGECSLTHLVCCSITAGKIKVLDYLNRNYCFSLDEILDVRGRSLLFLAIECENEAVYYLCQVNPSWVNKAAPNGNSPLMFAVNLNKRDIIQHLIGQGAVLDYWNKECDGATALHLAVLLGSHEVVEILLHAGADKSVKMGVPADRTPLHLAEELGHEKLIELLIA